MLTDAERLQMTALAFMKHNVVGRPDTYIPEIWNEDLDSFYIDFKYIVEPFSMGMFVQSISVYGSIKIIVNAVEKINDKVYKVYCNLSGQTGGIRVTNENELTFLRFSNGRKIPSFATHAFLSGIDSYQNTDYIYETVQYNDYGTISDTVSTDADIKLHDAAAISNIRETTEFETLISETITETVSIQFV